MLNEADSGNLGAAEGDGGVVNTLEDQLVLDILGWVHLNSASWLHLDEMGLLSSQEVFDFNLGFVLGNNGSDREMCMYHFHSVSEAFCDTNDAVADEGFEGGNRTSLFISSVPHLNSDVEPLHLLCGHFHNSDVDRLVGEIFGDLSSWTSNSDFSTLHTDFDSSWDLQIVFFKNYLHVSKKCLYLLLINK